MVVNGNEQGWIEVNEEGHKITMKTNVCLISFLGLVCAALQFFSTG
jgi:hypothetical protein